MAERDLIELTVRLPAGALEGFSRLASELRDLAQALREGGTPSSAPLRGEQGENAAFDLGRFQALTNRPQPPGRAEAAVSRTADPLRAEAPAPLEAPRAAGDGLEGAPEAREVAPPPAASPVPDAPAEQPRQELRKELDIPTAEIASLRPKDGRDVREPERRPPETPQAEAHRAAADAVVPEARAVRETAEGDLAEARGLRSGPDSPSPVPEAVPADWDRSLPGPAVFRAEGPSGGAGLQTAGFALSAGPELPLAGRSAAPESLPPAESAGLSAEAVSLAFRRDSRRYDGGFTLF